MRKIIIVILITIFSSQVFCQIYTANKGSFRIYADIKKDSTHVEIFSCTYPDFVINKCDEYLFSNNKSNDTCFLGQQSQILKRKNDYYLLFKTSNRDRVIKAKLGLCTNDNRAKLRNEAYACERRINIMRLQDSILGSSVFIYPSVNNSIRRVMHHYSSDSNLLELVDVVADSLVNQILNVHKPTVDYYRQMGDSIDKIDTAAIYNLLSNANYKNDYSHLFLYKLSLVRPECLIQYVDKNPSNKDALLFAIRDHKKNKAIIKKIKETSLETIGKKEIIKQRAKRIKKTILHVAVVTGYVASQIAIIVLIVVWIV